MEQRSNKVTKPVPGRNSAYVVLVCLAAFFWFPSGTAPAVPDNSPAETNAVPKLPKSPKPKITPEVQRWLDVQPGATLCVGAYYTPEEGKAMLDRLLEGYPTAEAFKARVQLLRRCILRGLTLSPLPKRTPLNPIVRPKRVKDGYSVENVAFESIPGFYVCGNLYRPLNPNGSCAAVLCPHGHFLDKTNAANLDERGRFRSDMQKRCAAMARMGAVVFAYDMYAWGESLQQFDNKPEHRTPLSMTMQTWNSIRAVDFLLSLKDVDSKRIAVTGASGGGTQGFILAALDDRIAVSVPVVMVSSWFFGGCGCEASRPIHKSAEHESSNAEIAAMAAPRPQLVMSDGDDWTKTVPDIEYPYLKKVYALFGGADKVQNVHFPDGHHDYAFPKRAALYPFLAKHLGLDLKPVQQADGQIDESRIEVEKAAALMVFDQEHPMPATALHGSKAIEAVLRSLQQ